MDFFNEQIVKKHKTPLETATVILIYVAAWVIAFGLVLVGLRFSAFMVLFILIACGAIWGSLKLAATFNIEFEYCVTNSDLDIDKIINKNSRKRLISINIADIEEMSLYDESKLKNRSFDHTVNAVADNNLPVYFAYLRTPEKGKTLLLFQPDEKILTAMKKSLPRLLAYQLDKD